MPNALIVNAHFPSPVSAGELNGSLVAKATTKLEAKGYSVRHKHVVDDWDIEQELADHQ